MSKKIDISTANSRRNISGNAYNVFISTDECVEYCKVNFGIDINIRDINFLADLNILPIFESGKDRCVIINDLKSLATSIAGMSVGNNIGFLDGLLFEKEVITPCLNTRIDLAIAETETNPIFRCATRNLLAAIPNLSDNGDSTELATIPYFPPGRVFTTSKTVLNYITDQKKRADKADMTRASQFTRSAHYMGSKRALSPFLVEALSSVLPLNGIVIDLMCGSGVASGAFSKFWDVISSDSQEFCRILSIVHGGGFSRTKAKELLDNIIPIAKKHSKYLQDILFSHVEAENIIFHSDIGDELLKKYQNFIDDFPTFSNKKSVPNWDPTTEVTKRQKNSSLYPYCLFTTYYANSYFGLRQCIEIDSLRFAIDHLTTEKDRYWAIGSLIPTISDLGTTFGGHFAQPPIRAGKDLTFENLSSVIDKRAYSVMHEFSVRLLNLSETSEISPRPIETIPGPWQNALAELGKVLADKNDVVVYLDAPYKREDYSRFYHVLETLVKYSYHSCIGFAKAPDIRKDERFRSEFSTQNKNKITQKLCEIIIDIINRGWICAWSYSNTGDADIISVLDQVNAKTECEIKSYSTPYMHKSHGGRKPKDVIEYLILFVPKK